MSKQKKTRKAADSNRPVASSGKGRKTSKRAPAKSQALEPRRRINVRKRLDARAPEHDSEQADSQLQPKTFDEHDQGPVSEAPSPPAPAPEQQSKTLAARRLREHVEVPEHPDPSQLIWLLPVKRANDVSVNTVWETACGRYRVVWRDSLFGADSDGYIACFQKVVKQHTGGSLVMMDFIADATAHGYYPQHFASVAEAIKVLEHLHAKNLKAVNPDAYDFHSNSAEIIAATAPVAAALVEQKRTARAVASSSKSSKPPKEKKEKKEKKPAGPKRETAKDKYGTRLGTQAARITEYALALKKPFLPQEIADALSCKASAVAGHMYALTARGFAERLDKRFRMKKEAK